jgi:hypothetical protein
MALSSNGSHPAYDCEAVTPHDTNEIEFRSLFVGGAGNISLVTLNGNTVAFTGVLAGSILPVQGRKVRSTGTTATNIVALK